MALHQARAKGLHYAKPGVCFATVCLSVYFTLAPTATSPPPDRALHWLLLFPPSPYRSPAAHPPLCGRQAVHRPPGGPAFSRLAYGQSGPTRALERPHRGSTPTSDFCGTYVRPPQRIPTPKNPMPAPPSFKCRGPWHGNQRTSDRLWAVSDVWLRSDSSSCVLSDDPTRGTHKGRCLVIARRPCRDQPRTQARDIRARDSAEHNRYGLTSTGTGATWAYTFHLPATQSTPKPYSRRTT